MNHIAEDFKYNKGLVKGHQIIIEPNVQIGENVKLGHRVTLKSGTVIGNNSILDDHCITTGACFIGNNVNIRTGAIISKATIIEDYSFIGPGVITNHTKHVTHGREDQVINEQLLTIISYGSIIGSQASLLAGVFIGPQSIVGGGSVIVKDLPGYSVYAGSPAKYIRKIPKEYEIKLPTNAGFMYCTNTILKELQKYMPALKTKYFSTNE